MDSIFLVLVIFLLILACVDLFVGVSNDAVNFLNSAVGCRIAPLFVVLIVASFGVLFGATFSSGMMEVARSGMFHPDMFTFKEILLVFCAVMITDVLLLNIFNSLGLPTSTTVSIVFELLGASVCAALYKLHMTEGNFIDVFDYIKSDRAITIVSAILVSVAVAFVSGAIVQFICRLLFTFRFKNTYKYLGGIFSGFSLTAIFYFLVMKGAKGASFMKPEYIAYIDENTSSILWTCFISLTIFSQLLVILKVNVFRIIILGGTFALAFSFAGNDLVNFIGVPLAALDSFLTWSALGVGADDLLMNSLNESSKTPTYFLLLAGLIMVVTLWTSKKARRVIQTSINLSSSNRGAHEQFGASTPGRVVTRLGLSVSRAAKNITPEFLIRTIAYRYRKQPIVKGEVPLPFDYVRASINLVLASILISSATSLKLPLSTTYVTFMVAMGTSFADGAWDRESAVYRISGVITVIAGWFLTAFCAFAASSFVCYTFFSFGTPAIVLFMACSLAIIIKTNFIKKKESETIAAVIDAKNDNSKILETVSAAVPTFFDNHVDVLRRIFVNFFEDNEYQIRKARNKASNILEEINSERSAYYTMALETNVYAKNDNPGSVDAKHFFYLAFSNMREVSKSIRYAADQAVNHVANRHTIFEGQMKESIFELLRRVEKINIDMHAIAIESTASNVEAMIKHAKKLNREIDKSQIDLVTIIGKQKVSMHSAEMYLTFLQTIRDVANRYVAVAMQQRALSQIVAGYPVDEIVEKAPLQTQIMPAAIRTHNEEVVDKLDAEDDDLEEIKTESTKETTEGSNVDKR